MPGIKYSTQWEPESLLLLNYRSVFNCAFYFMESMKISAEWNILDTKDHGNFPLYFITQDTFQRGVEYALKQFHTEKYLSVLKFITLSLLEQIHYIWKFLEMKGGIHFFHLTHFENKRSGYLSPEMFGDMQLQYRKACKTREGVGNK